jgi:hypothetical protein
MNIELILQIISVMAPIIADCFEQEQSGVDKLRRAPLRVAWRMQRELMKAGASREEARESTREAMKEIRAATDEELREFLAMCHESASPR